MNPYESPTSEEDARPLPRQRPGFTIDGKTFVLTLFAAILALVGFTLYSLTAVVGLD